MSNWANRGKEALAAVSAVPGGMKVRSGGGDLEPLQFYTFNPPKNAASKSKVLEVGASFEGTYEGFIETDGKYGKSVTYKVRTATGLVGLPGCAQINNELKDKVPVGTKIFLQRAEDGVTKTGKFAGSPQKKYIIAY